MSREDNRLLVFYSDLIPSRGLRTSRNNPIYMPVMSYSKKSKYSLGKYILKKYDIVNTDDLIEDLNEYTLENIKAKYVQIKFVRAELVTQIE